MKSEAAPCQGYLNARQMLVPVAQKLCRCKRGRTCVHSWTLLCTETIYFCL